VREPFPARYPYAAVERRGQIEVGGSRIALARQPKQIARRS
jgi:hypothetical protein